MVSLDNFIVPSNYMDELARVKFNLESFFKVTQWIFWAECVVLDGLVVMIAGAFVAFGVVVWVVIVAALDVDVVLLWTSGRNVAAWHWFKHWP